MAFAHIKFRVLCFFLLINVVTSTNFKAIREFGQINDIEILQVKDLTTNFEEFKIESKNLIHELEKRSKNSFEKKHFWHFMSGSSAFFPDIGKNILIERAFQCVGPGHGYECPPLHNLQKSFIAYSLWSKDWSTKLARTRILNINESAGTIYRDDLGLVQRVCEGPEDSRAFYNPTTAEFNINFNMLDMKESRAMFFRAFKFDKKRYFDAPRSASANLKLLHSFGIRRRTEKNWTPILINGEAHYVYSLAPLRIIKCEPSNLLSKTCNVMFDGAQISSQFAQTGKLRGGTNWIEHSPGIFFSLARTRVIHRCNYPLYRPNLVVIKFAVDLESKQYTNPQLIHVSAPVIELDEVLFKLFENKTKLASNRLILTPGSITNWTGEESDILDIVIGVNDDISSLVQVKGLGSAISNIIKAYSNKTLGSISDQQFCAEAERSLNQYALSVK